MAQTMTPARQAKADAAQAAAAAEPEVPEVPQPDPAKAGALLLDALGQTVALIESIQGSAPMLHGLATRVAALRKTFDQVVFHSSPPA